MDSRPTNATVIVRIAALALAVGLVADLLLRGHAIGVNVVLLTGALLLATFAIRPRDRGFDRLDAWLPVAAVVFAIFPALRADHALVVIDGLAVILLSGATVAAAAGASVTRRTLLAGLGLASTVTAFAGAGALVVLGRFPGRRAAAELGRRAGPQATPIIRGLIIGLPLVAIFAVLFSRADPIFERWVGDVTTFNLDIGELPAHVVVVAATAWLVAGLLFLVATGEPAREPQSLGAAAASPTLAWPRLGLTEALTVLVILDLVVGAFAILQVGYLFGGLDTISAIGLTYAEYARRGFFELLLVGFLGGAIVGGMEATSTERPRRYVAALLGLIVLTGVVIVASAVRLRYYQEAYGWTELRFWVAASIGFLAVCFGGAAILVATNRGRWLAHAVAAAGVGVLLAINVLGPQAFVTERNLERALHPELIPPDGERTLDAVYLGRLDADAVPALVETLPFLPAVERAQVESSLRRFDVQLARDAPAGDWPAWNLARERAREALAGLFAPR